MVSTSDIFVIISPLISSIELVVDGSDVCDTLENISISNVIFPPSTCKSLVDWSSPNVLCDDVIIVSEFNIGVSYSLLLDWIVTRSSSSSLLVVVLTSPLLSDIGNSIAFRSDGGMADSIIPGDSTSFAFNIALLDILSGMSTLLGEVLTRRVVLVRFFFFFRFLL